MPRILVIDDANTIREALSTLLVANGYEVLAAETAEQGLETLSKHTVDLVITDLNMPGMDGITMCSHIKERGYNLPIFMLTTQSNPDLKARAREFGVLAWIVKPHKDDVLLKGIQKVLKLPT